MARKQYGLTKEEKAVMERIAHFRQPINLLPASEKPQPRKSFKEIADILNAEGVLPQAAKAWTEMLVRNVFYNGVRK